MDPNIFIAVLHVPVGPHFSKSGTAMVVPVVAGATPLKPRRLQTNRPYALKSDAEKRPIREKSICAITCECLQCSGVDS